MGIRNIAGDQYRASAVDLDLSCKIDNFYVFQKLEMGSVTQVRDLIVENVRWDAIKSRAQIVAYQCAKTTWGPVFAREFSGLAPGVASHHIR